MLKGESLIIPVLNKRFGHFDDAVKVGAISAAVFHYFFWSAGVEKLGYGRSTLPLAREDGTAVSHRNELIRQESRTVDRSVQRAYELSPGLGPCFALIFFSAPFQFKKSKGVSVHKWIGSEAEIVIIDPLGINL